MTIAITGATGQLGRLVLSALLRLDVPREQLVAAGRSREKLRSLRELELTTARIDYGDPASLDAAFDGADTVLLISSSEVGSRVDQHRNAVEAAVRAGAGRLVYTSALGADRGKLLLADEHLATEELVTGSGLPWTIVRNGWYTENFEPAVHYAAETGFVLSNAGGGRVASATREDYAEGIAAVLAQDGHAWQTYELSGDTAWDHDELAATLTRVLGREVVHRRLSPEQHLAALEESGVDEATARFLVALDANIEDGALDLVTGDLSRLIGRPTTALEQALRTIAGDSYV
ncbi:NAD(P)-dependent oxidoreductase [Kocuria flava]|uniref:NAD(P)-dependent oxidoreductase n=1 Tax=Kocuria flava TaxID=446860 RepID=A0A0U3GA14_9MICC|nr:SDR family oxidoreductase [Kocuria flava]ALU39947.1 NAD(P)-dependent oxidoreductase [Kocuria flava]GEO93539.1 NAD(P)-dependent oxidoreductase [Kocuria flava]